MSGPRVRNLSDLPPYAPVPGDLFFCVPSGQGVVAEQCGIVSTDTARYIQYLRSTLYFPDNGRYSYQSGVVEELIVDAPGNWVVFRLNGASDLPQRAALLARDWVGHNMQYGDGATYGAATPNNARSDRAARAGLDCKFGLGAAARLLKYQRNPGLKPKHLRDAEMCVLAYQLSTSENDSRFIRLDAELTSTPALYTYVNRSSQWRCVGQRKGRPEQRPYLREFERFYS